MAKIRLRSRAPIWLGAVVALAPLFGCASASLPPPRSCTGAGSCLNLLCDSASSAPELAAAARQFSSSQPSPAPEASARWAACTRSALLRARDDAPARCGLPRSPLSIWDLANAGGLPDDATGRLVLGCAPRAAFLISAAPPPATSADVLSVLREGMRSKNRWVFRISRRTLLRAGDAEALAATKRHLHSKDPVERAKAVDDFAAAGAAAQPYVGSIMAAAPSLLPRDRRSLLPFALGHIGGEEAGRALAEQLLAPELEIREVLDACERLGRDARAAAPTLRSLAAGHVFLDVRERAARAYTSATGDAVTPGPGSCPRFVRAAGASFRVRLEDGESVLSAIRTPTASRAAEAGACARFISEGSADVALQIRGTCLLGVNHGEFGGWLEARDLASGWREEIASTNPLKLFPDGRGGALLVSGIAHLFIAAGWVDRVTPTANGRWLSRRIAKLDGVPVAYRRDRSDLLVLVAGADPGCKANRFALVRIAPSGQMTADEPSRAGKS